MLKTTELKKDFRKKPVVMGVSLEIFENEVVCLLGENGAGKSTTFKMIMGTLTPSSGKVEFLGKDISSWAMHKRCRAGMGYLAQEPTIFTGLTVEQNLLAILEQVRLSRRERNKRCDELLDEFGLRSIRKNPSIRCSGGEKRRLEIARALITEPRLILLDEPFAGVDPKHTGEIRDHVHGLKDRGISVLVTDHDARNTLKASDRAYIMSHGRIVKSGTPDEVVNDEECREAYFGHDFDFEMKPAAANQPAGDEDKSDDGQDG